MQVEFVIVIFISRIPLGITMMQDIMGFHVSLGYNESHSWKRKVYQRNKMNSYLMSLIIHTHAKGTISLFLINFDICVHLIRYDT